MQLTSEERIVRDSYLLSKRLGRNRWLSFEGALIVVSAGTFIYGFMMDREDRAMLVVGYCLALLVGLRFAYGTFFYRPRIESLIAKYEEEITGKKAAEPGATDNPDGAQRLREDH